MKTQRASDGYNYTKWYPTRPGDVIGAWATAGPGGPATFYSGADLYNIVHASHGIRNFAFQIDLLNADRSFKSDLTPFVYHFNVSFSDANAVMRTLTLQLVETVASTTIEVTNVGGQTYVSGAGINYQQDRVRPHYCLLAPNGGWIKVPLGTFYFQTAGASMPGFAVLRNDQLSDIAYYVQQTQALDETGVLIPMTTPANMLISNAIHDLISNSPTNVPPTDGHWTRSNIPGCGLDSIVGQSGYPASTALTPPQGYQWGEGTSYLEIINKFLFYIRYYNMLVDSTGLIQFQPWPSNQDYRTLNSEWSYDTTTNSIIAVGGTETIDLSTLKNAVNVIVDDTQRSKFTATAAVWARKARNDPAWTPTSPIDVDVIGHLVTDVVQDSGIPGFVDQNWATTYAIQQLLLKSRLMDQIQIPTLINPFHEFNDIISFNIWQRYVAAGSPQNQPIIVGNLPGLTLTEKFIVTGWTIDAQLQSLGSGVAPQGGAGLTSQLSARDTLMGSTMQLTAQRITSMADRADIYVYSGTL